MGEDNFFKKKCWENWIFICKRLNLDGQLKLYTKSTQNLLKTSMQVAKLQEEKSQGRFLDISLSNYFLEMTSKTQARNIKIGKQDYIKPKKLLHNIWNKKHNEKTIYKTGENICKSCI